MKTHIRIGPAGPSVLTIHRNGVFFITDHAGQVQSQAELGLFYKDTRFVSQYEFSINGQSWLPLQSVSLGYFANRFYFNNPVLSELEGHTIPEGDLTLQVDREIAGGIKECLILYNHSRNSQKLRLRIRLDGDFCDFFDLRAHRYISRGVRDSYWNPELGELVIHYSNGTFSRSLVYKIESDSPPHFSAGQILFAFELPPRSSWTSRHQFVIGTDGLEATIVDGLHNTSLCQESFSRWREATTQLNSSNRDLCDIYQRAIEDIGGLRVHEHDLSREIWIPVAGIPWFVTLFGRDSLIVAYQSMMIASGFGFGALAKLAELQARENDPYRDAEPGKILHEIRSGELAHFRKIPHTPYYGTADATILFLIVLSELFRWTGSIALLKRFRATAEACLNWIDREGDRDGDGFQEYKTRSPAGYYNQGWKDAGDAVVYPDGERVVLPIGTCELQGYVYDAKLRIAEVFEALKDDRRAERLRRQAQDLCEHFRQSFWLPDHEYVAYCLDGNKQAVATVASNAGHCLWSGILDPNQAEAVANRLFAPDLWTGWGVRTLSANNPAYNPVSYQRGSVWPHDNGIIAEGLCRYGYRDLANRIAQGIFNAASAFEQFRLPELFAGFPRDTHPFPVQYRHANVPQAWAAGSVFHLLRTMLGINPDVPNGKIYIDPALPDWIDDLMIENLRVGSDHLRLKFQCRGGKSMVEIIDHEGRLGIENGPPPWFSNR